MKPSLIPPYSTFYDDYESMSIRKNHEHFQRDSYHPAEFQEIIPFTQSHDDEKSSKESLYRFVGFRNGHLVKTKRTPDERSPTGFCFFCPYVKAPPCTANSQKGKGILFPPNWFPLREDFTLSPSSPIIVRVPSSSKNQTKPIDSIEIHGIFKNHPKNPPVHLKIENPRELTLLKCIHLVEKHIIYSRRKRIISKVNLEFDSTNSLSLSVMSLWGKHRNESLDEIVGGREHQKQVNMFCAVDILEQLCAVDMPEWAPNDFKSKRRALQTVFNVNEGESFPFILRSPSPAREIVYECPEYFSCTSDDIDDEYFSDESSSESESFESYGEKEPESLNCETCENAEDHLLHFKNYCYEYWGNPGWTQNNPVKFFTKKEEYVPIYRPTPDERASLSLELMKEVIANGFIDDLLYGSLTRDAPIDVLNLKMRDLKTFQIMRVVEAKMAHPWHKKMGDPLINKPAFMLSLILCTDGECNYDLCQSQRDGNYEKWKIFDFCLDSAIRILSKCESFDRDFPLFCGLRHVKFHESIVESGFFPTYLHASKSKHVAVRFRGKRGVLFKIEKSIKSLSSSTGRGFLEPCADVSWISQFDFELEVLFRRGVAFPWRAEVTRVRARDDGEEFEQFVNLSLSDSLKMEHFAVKMCRLVHGKDHVALPAKDLVLSLNWVTQQIVSRTKKTKGSRFLAELSACMEEMGVTWVEVIKVFDNRMDSPPKSLFSAPWKGEEEDTSPYYFSLDSLEWMSLRKGEGLRNSPFGMWKIGEGYSENEVSELIYPKMVFPKFEGIIYWNEVAIESQAFDSMDDVEVEEKFDSEPTPTHKSYEPEPLRIVKYFLQRSEEIAPVYEGKEEDTDSPILKLVKEVVSRCDGSCLRAPGFNRKPVPKKWSPRKLWEVYEMFPHLSERIAEKMNHKNHKRMKRPLRGRPELILALMLSTDARGPVYKMRKAQRNGDYETWKYFDSCLAEGIQLLSKCEVLSYRLYFGWRNVYVENKEEGISKGYFPTYVSASRDRHKAGKFARGRGIVVEIGKNISQGKGKALCCHIHWLSEFPREREVLFSRCGDFCWQMKEKKGESTERVQRFKLEKEGIDIQMDEEIEYWEMSDGGIDE